jgi:hypothetical protein
MLFAHLKRIFRLGRLRLRGPCVAQFEFTMAAIAQSSVQQNKRIVGDQFKPSGQSPRIHDRRLLQQNLPEADSCTAARERPYSMISSAAADMPSGTLRPSAFAVFKLITNSNLLDCMTGRSAGFSPLRILPV